jgi:hypothetical protein
VFDLEEISESVEIHRRCYGLLRWLGGAIERGFISCETAHDYATEAEATEAWISEHYQNLPSRFRPPRLTGDPFHRFANFFASYLTTSFDIIENPQKTTKSECGCFCPACTYIGSAPHLRVKKVTPAHKRRAEKMKYDYLAQLALNRSGSIREDEIGRLLADASLSRKAALATYGAELLNRCQGRSSGPAALALWRQFAWASSGSPDREFELTAREIMAAETALCELLPS